MEKGNQDTPMRRSLKRERESGERVEETHGWSGDGESSTGTRADDTEPHRHNQSRAMDERGAALQRSTTQRQRERRLTRVVLVPSSTAPGRSTLTNTCTHPSNRGARRAAAETNQ
ncbi:hypothetical protein NL108_008142 [Boleophthalmus pectinirostris]|nr:hypothetical protein NL108_008142 [Boleophthalmus pectinirostris]